MLKIFAVCLVIAPTVLVDHAVMAMTREQTHAVRAQSQKKPPKPKLGYLDLFIPPTKGNGF
ncbi:hypothetical protein AS026_31280 [Rhizobium altiplani]|uniref:Uncharacterized protein n=1 Tax=Rhizobium altiplani TaxID=1864509 RepID=A0A120FPK6_9HYPH|nr:hypothetical protein [Rhizobium altiplani]KWV57124.1 hypothetical protein AS026_31280 [Rhizobium altiplani]